MLLALKSVWNRSSPPTAATPAVGEKPPAGGGGLSLPVNTPTIIAFVRHCGCPFATKEIRLLGEQAQQNPQLHVIIVQHSAEPVVKEWFDTIGGPAAFGDAYAASSSSSTKEEESTTSTGNKQQPSSRVTLVADPERTIYAAWGVGVLGWGGLFGGVNAMMAKVKALQEEGIAAPFTLEGSWRWQNSGGFAIGSDGLVKWQHIAENAADMCDYPSAAAKAVI